jgi:hypothetical protein
VDSNYPGKFRGKSLQAMTTEELEELLRQEQDTDGMPDVDYIKAILAVLEAREEAPHVDVDTAWGDFKENYISGEPLYPMPTEELPKSQPPRAKKKPLFRIAIIAAVLLVLVIGASITASAAGFNLWRAFVEWTSETLGIQFRETIDFQHEWNPELYDLNYAVSQVGMPKSKVPHYLPDGFKQVFIQINDDEVIAQYSKDDESIIIQYFRIVSDNGEYYERDDGYSERYTVGGIDHVLFTNLGTYLATWSNDGWECSIMGVPTKQDLLRMIDSIYLEEKP